MKNIHIPLWAVTSVGIPTFMPTLEGAALKETPCIERYIRGGSIKWRWLSIKHVGGQVRLL
jgi:hypothetical protein